MTQGKLMAGLVAFAALCVVGWILATGVLDDSAEQGDGAEYAALAEIPHVTPNIPAFEETESEEPVVAPSAKEPGQGGLSMVAPSAEDSGGAVPVGKVRGHRFNVYGGPASEFDNTVLAGIGYDAEEIAEIRTDFSAYINELRDFDPDARVTPATSLTAEERDQNRSLRERYLDDREYDAALIATRQQNRAYFAGPIPAGRTAAQVGIEAGDEILELNGVRIFNAFDFADARDSLSEGEMHRLVISRKRKILDVTVRCCNPGWGRVLMRLGRPLDEPLRN